MTIKEKILKDLNYWYISNDIVFDKGKHQYKLGGVTCAGVSTISEFRPAPYLIGWAAKMVVEHLKDKQGIIKDCTPKEYDALLDEAKKLYRTKSKEATDIGERAHKWIEDHIGGVYYKTTADIENPVKQFLDFESKHKVDWIATEKIVCSRTHLVAGRLDALAMVDGILSLVDLKTSNRISESYLLQTAGYAMCLAEMGIPVARRLILRLPKAIEDTFEAVECITPLKDDVDAFLGQRYAYAWSNMIDCKFTEEVEGKHKTKKLKLKKI